MSKGVKRAADFENLNFICICEFHLKLRAISFQIFVALFSLVKGLLSLKLMTRLGHENYAMLAQFMIVSTFGVQIIVASFDAPLVASIVSEKNARSARTSFLLLLGANFSILALISVFFSNQISSFFWGDAAYFEYVPYLVLYIGVLSLNHFFLVNFQGGKNFRAYGAIQFAQQILQLLAICLGVFTNSVIGLVTFLVVAEFALWILLIFFNRNKPMFARISVGEAVNWIVGNFKIAAPLFIVFLLIWVLTNGARLALVNLGGLSKLAPFAATFSISILAGIVINPICTIFFPYFSSVGNKGGGSKDALVAAQLALAFLTTLASIFIILSCGRFLSYLVGGNLYVGDFFVFFICAAQVAYAQARIATLYLSVNEKPKRGALYFSIGVIVMLAIDLGLAQKYGANGVAFAYLVGCFVTAFLFFRDAYADREKLKSLSDFKKLIWFFGLGLVVMLACLVTPIDSWGAMVGAFLFFSLAYVVFSYMIFSNEIFLVGIKQKIASFIGSSRV